MKLKAGSIDLYGISTLRCANIDYLFQMIARILAKNHEPGKKTLYLHWVDYHKRFWTLDYDLIMKTAKKYGCDTRSLADDIYFMRSFSRDNNEVEKNWKDLAAFGHFDLIILDSISELYAKNDGQPKSESSLPMTYSIGRFAQLCIKNNCPGIVLDYSRYLHPYLAEISSVIMEFEIGNEISVKLLKHPCMADTEISFPRDGQHRLPRWI
jgi:hypothetical protein